MRKNYLSGTLFLVFVASILNMRVGAQQAGQEVHVGGASQAGQEIHIGGQEAGKEIHAGKDLHIGETLHAGLGTAESQYNNLKDGLKNTARQAAGKVRSAGRSGAHTLHQAVVPHADAGKSLSTGGVGRSKPIKPLGISSGGSQPTPPSAKANSQQH